MRIFDALLLIPQIDAAPKNEATRSYSLTWFNRCAVRRFFAASSGGIALLATLVLHLPAANAQPVAASRIATGLNHACSITTGGGVQCWGDNFFGQLGDGTTFTRTTPITVGGLTGVVALAAGSAHTCALTGGGAVLCWGSNGYGQLGNGNFTPQKTPVAVTGLASGVLRIATGANHTCAITAGGAVQCWGYNQYGSVGNGDVTGTDRNVPTAVSGMSSGVSALALGTYHSCAVGTGGAVSCWGGNGSGQLGDGTVFTRITPVPVTGYSSGAVSLAAGDGHTCALDTGGGVKCWGWNGNGQLGDNTTAPHYTPAPVTTLGSGIAAIAAGSFHSCALLVSGGVKCWGANTYGGLGDGSNNQRPLPVAVSGLASGAIAVAAGRDFSCALGNDGAIRCWGSAEHAQMGNATFPGPLTPSASQTTPVFVNGIVAITAGDSHTCSLTASGEVLCWGQNYAGQLGDGTSTRSRDTPVRVSGLGSGVTAVAAGGAHTCALSNGGVKCWGGNAYGQLGDGTTNYRNIPGPVSGLASGVAAIAAGAIHTCALTTGGAVKCWGGNFSGQVGNGTIVQQNAPVAVTGLGSGVASISAGTAQTCAVTTAGAAQCWGANYYGLLGIALAPPYYSSVPVAVFGLSSGVSTIATGLYHSCARTTAAAARCWGGNYRGQLGSGASDALAHLASALVTGLSSGVSAIAANGDHACVLTSTAGVSCWGRGDAGQLGDGTGADRTAPVPTSGLPSAVTSVATGAAHTCARTIAGGVQCWGRNDYGQLGVGTQAASNTPLAVSAASESPFQNISFALPAGATRADSSVALNGVASSALPLDYTVTTPATCELSGTYVNLLAEGTCTLTASQPGDSNYFSAPAVSRTMLIHSPTPTLSAGLDHNAVVSGGIVYAWGGNTGGKLGNDATASSSVPVLSYLGGPSGVTALATGMSHTLAVANDGSVWVWGLNNHDQLGLGLATPSTCLVPGESTFGCAKSPVQLPGLSGVVAVGAGWGHSVALRSDGSVWTWGANGGLWGELGRSTATVPTSAPGKVDLSALTNLPIVEIAVGYFHVVARKSDGTLIAWGRGANGELGNNTRTTSLPVNVSLLTDVVSISARGSHTLAKKSDGTLWAWGWNVYGQMGDGTKTDRLIPYQVMTSVADMSAGFGFNIVRKNDGTVWVWGLNKSGQLGLATSDLCGFSNNLTCSKIPVKLTAQTGATGVLAGGAHSIVIRPDNSLVFYGDNTSGQLGNKSGNFGGKFIQQIYDPDFGLTPQGTYGSGASVGTPSSTGGLNLQTIGNGYTFDAQRVGIASSEVLMTLTNTRPPPTPPAINISAIAASDDFRISSHDCGTALAAGPPCTIRVVFTPTATGDRYGSLSISSDLTDTPSMSFNLTGAGVDAPAVPAITGIVPGNAQVTVNFTPPADSGGSPITQYVATCGSFTATGTPFSSSLTVTGLTNGTTYTCTVTVTNAAGLSTSSLTVTATPSLPAFTVTPSVTSANGSISPPLPQSVNQGATFMFTVTPAAGYFASVGGTCTGALVVNTYTTSPVTANCTVEATFTSTLVLALVAVQSRKSHVTAGPFDLLIDGTQPIGGAVTVEPRVIGVGHQIVFQFNQAITSVGGATVSPPGVATPSFTGTEVTVTLTGVADNRRVTVALTNVNGSMPPQVSLGFLVGDVNSTRSVNSSDISGVKARSGQATTAANFRFDVNASGAINSSDISAVKARSGLVLP